MSDRMKNGLLDPYVMRHQLGGVTSGLTTALEIFESRPKEVDAAGRLLRMCVERLNEILEELERSADRRASAALTPERVGS